MADNSFPNNGDNWRVASIQPFRPVPHCLTRAPGGHSQLTPYTRTSLSGISQVTTYNSPIPDHGAPNLADGAITLEPIAYVLDTNPPSQTPKDTLISRSRMACAAKCSSLEDWSCDGFQYVAEGTCRLYPKTPFCPISAKNTTMPSPETPEETTTETGLSDQPAIYRRRRADASSACPGMY